MTTLTIGERESQVTRSKAFSIAVLAAIVAPMAAICLMGAKIATATVILPLLASGATGSVAVALCLAPLAWALAAAPAALFALAARDALNQ
jgi:hypothetical protein